MGAFVGGEMGVSRGDESAVENDAKDEKDDDVAAEFRLVSARLCLAVDFTAVVGTGVVAIDNGPSSRLIVDNPFVVLGRLFAAGTFSLVLLLLLLLLLSL